MTTDTVKLFVYGTLMQGMGNHLILGSDAKLLGVGTIEGYKMYSISDLYPAIAKSEDGSIVQGELYSISQEAFRDCDVLESYPHHYNRERTLVKHRRSPHLSGEQAWVYFYRNPEYLYEDHKLHHGCWRSYISQHNRRKTNAF